MLVYLFIASNAVILRTHSTKFYIPFVFLFVWLLFLFSVTPFNHQTVKDSLQNQFVLLPINYNEALCSLIS